jgi:hypothetical protein
MTPLGAFTESEDEYVYPSIQQNVTNIPTSPDQAISTISNKYDKNRSKIDENITNHPPIRAVLFLVVLHGAKENLLAAVGQNFGMRGQNLDRDGYIETIFLLFLQNSNGAQARPPLHR